MDAAELGLVPEYIKINGCEQCFLFRVHNDDRPVLLWFHGGPGSTLMPWTEYFDTTLLEHYSIIHWDQRCAGRSFNPSACHQPPLMDDMMTDTLRVVELVKQRIGQRSLILVGHSWGSILSLHVSRERPELMEATVSIGTVVDMKRADGLKLAFLRDRETDLNQIDTLSKLGPAPFSERKDALFISNRLAHYGAVFGSLTMEQLEVIQRSSSVYRSEDWQAQADGAYFSIESLIPQLKDYRATERVPNVKAPVVFIQGALDMATPTELVKEYYTELIADHGKYWFEIEGCAHFPMWEQPNIFRSILRDGLSQAISKR